MTGSGESAIRRELQKSLTQAKKSDTRIAKLKEEIERKNKQWLAYAKQIKLSFYKQQKAHETDIARLEQEIQTAAATGREAATQMQALVLYGARPTMETEEPADTAWEQLMSTGPPPERPPSDFLQDAMETLRRMSQMTGPMPGTAPVLGLPAPRHVSATTENLGLGSAPESVPPGATAPAGATSAAALGSGGEMGAAFGPVPGLETVGHGGPFVPTPEAVDGLPSMSPQQSPGTRARAAHASASKPRASVKQRPVMPQPPTGGVTLDQKLEHRRALELLAAQVGMSLPMLGIPAAHGGLPAPGGSASMAPPGLVPAVPASAPVHPPIPPASRALQPFGLPPEAKQGVLLSGQPASIVEEDDDEELEDVLPGPTEKGE